MSQSTPKPDPALSSTSILLDRVQRGDQGAAETLVARYLPVLQRWAHGRLPAEARGLVDTHDLVQVTLIKALDHMKGFHSRREGAFFAYLRRILLNSLRDELRRARRRPQGDSIEESLADPSPTALELQVGKETLELYEAALASLPEQHQEAVILRIEFGFTHPQIAEALGMPSENAARMCVSRALIRLAEQIHDRRQP
jgi:RNA polymerase sigma-70 factor (ECF subfamily)